MWGAASEWIQRRQIPCVSSTGSVLWKWPLQDLTTKLMRSIIGQKQLLCPVLLQALGRNHHTDSSCLPGLQTQHNKALRWILFSLAYPRWATVLWVAVTGRRKGQWSCRNPAMLQRACMSQSSTKVLLRLKCSHQSLCNFCTGCLNHGLGLLWCNCLDTSEV